MIATLSERFECDWSGMKPSHERYLDIDAELDDRFLSLFISRNNEQPFRLRMHDGPVVYGFISPDVPIKGPNDILPLNLTDGLSTYEFRFVFKSSEVADLEFHWGRTTHWMHSTNEPILPDEVFESTRISLIKMCKIRQLGYSDIGG